MRFNLTRLLQELSGRRGTELIQLLLQQIDAATQGLQVARDAACTEADFASARVAIAASEHVGGRARDALVGMLAGTLVTPLDREDMFRISRSIDNVLDNLADFVLEVDLFQANDELFTPVIDAVEESLRLLHSAIDGVAPSPQGSRARALRAKRSCNDIRRAYQQQMTILLAGEVTTELLCRRELLRRLDVVGLRIGEAVDALTDATIKRTI